MSKKTEGIIEELKGLCLSLSIDQEQLMKLLLDNGLIKEDLYEKISLNMKRHSI